MRGLLGTQVSTLVVIIGVVALFCAVGALLVGFGYARRGKKARTGAVLGGSIGAAIVFMIMGALGLAASNVNGDLNNRLVGIVSLVLGVLIIVMLRVLGPRPEEQPGAGLGTLSKLFSALKTPNPGTPSPKPERTLFISYRRDDAPDVTGRIYDTLVTTYGIKSVFKDIDSIPFGVDFRKHLATVIEKCDVVLVIMGDRWLTIEDSTGQQRISEQADFVRIEVESALQRDIPIVPVLVKGAAMPKETELPASIRDLAFRNGISVRYDPDFHHDMERLIHSLDEGFNAMPGKSG